MAAELSHRMGWIEDGLLQRLKSLLLRARLPISIPIGTQTLDLLT